MTWSLVLLVLSLLAPHQDAPLNIRRFETIHYPILAVASQIQRQVAVSFEIDFAGNVVNARATSGHSVLREAVEKNIKTWRFEPGRATTGEFIYEFKLEGLALRVYAPTSVTYQAPNHVTVVTNPRLPEY